MKKNLLMSGLLVLGMLNAVAVDWPVWRGPNGNSVTSETINAANLNATPVWTAKVGSGYSAISVFQGKALTAGNSGGNDIIYCMDANTGKIVWQYSYPCRVDKGYPGPRATPVTDGKNVYMLSIDGDLVCVNLADGKLVWEHKKMATGDVQNLKWGLASSVLLHDNVVYINLGSRGMTFDAATGKPLWKTSGTCNYSTPVIFKFGDRELLAIFGEKNLFILEPATGNTVASYEWLTKWNVNAAEPIITDGGKKILISSGYGHGAALLDFDGTSLKKIWENTNMCCHFSSPLLIDGIIYGVSGNPGGGILCAVDFNSGKLITKTKLKFGSLIQAGEQILYIEENGTLNVLNPAAGKCEVVKSIKVLNNGKCWTMPVLADGKIFCRNNIGDVVCLSAK